MSLPRTLSSYPFDPSTRIRLQQCGFTTKADIEGLRISDLARELGLSHEEALHIKRTVCETTVSKGTSALSLLQTERGNPAIFTLCQTLDQLLGGRGVPVGQVTEFCGVPGIGKTQLCMQLACDVSLPRTCGGMEGEAIYIDSEGSFIADRCLQIAQALVDKVTHSALNSGACMEELCPGYSEEAILKSIHYFRVYDYVEQLACLHNLKTFLPTHPKVRLIVVDSVAFHFRRGFDDFSMRARVLTGMAQALLNMANKHHLAVVLTNQVTTKIGTNKGATASHLAPALGESWAHACTNRVMLGWHNDVRQATLLKSPSLPPGTTSYAITVEGVRDIQWEAEGDERGATGAAGGSQA